MYQGRQFYFQHDPNLTHLTSQSTHQNIRQYQNLLPKFQENPLMKFPLRRNEHLLSLHSF